MTYKLTIPGTLPGLNEYIDAERRNRYAAAKMKRENMERVLWAVRQQLRGAQFRRPVWMRYEWIEPNRRRDKDNVSGYGRKIIQDALVKSGALKNDGWAQIEGFTDVFRVDKSPRIVVEITEVETKQ